MTNRPSIVAQIDAVNSVIEHIVKADEMHSHPVDERVPILRAAVETLEAARWRPQFRHKARGTDYMVVGEALLQTKDGVLHDNDSMIVYRGADGQLCVRGSWEFHDGRFEPLPTPPEPTDGRRN